MYWSPGDRVFTRQEGAIYPATIRGGQRTEIRNSRGAPVGFTESYIVSVAVGNSPVALRQIDGATILGAAPDE